MRSYRLLCLAKISNYLTQKKRGIVLLSIPRVEALALPIVVEQTTLEPTPIWKSCPHRDLYSIIDHIQQDTIYAYKAFTGFDIITPGTSTVDHIRDNNYEFARFDSSQTQRQINAFYMSWLSSHPLPAYYRESCLDFSVFSSALAVCVSTLSKPNLTHRFESHCKNNKFSSKRARFTWIFCQYCPILTFKELLLLYIKV